MEFDLDLSLDLLRRTPATLEALLDAAAEAWVRGTEGPETFSPFDVVGHLIDGEETDWIPRARIILGRGGDPRFEPYDRFRHRARNADRSLSSLLAEFARLRAASFLIFSCSGALIWLACGAVILRATNISAASEPWVDAAVMLPGMLIVIVFAAMIRYDGRRR